MTSIEKYVAKYHIFAITKESNTPHATELALLTNISGSFLVLISSENKLNKAIGAFISKSYVAFKCIFCT